MVRATKLGKAKKNEREIPWSKIAVIVSICGLVASMYIGYNQLSLQKRQYQPSISATEDSFYSPVTQLLERKEITVHNSGSELLEPTLRWGTFIEITFDESYRVEIPISGYYLDWDREVNRKEIAFRLVGGPNYDKIYYLGKEILAELPGTKSVCPVTYVEVRYKDKLHENHTVCFKAGGGPYCVEIPPEKAQPKIDTVERLREQHKILRFHKITSEKLRKAAERELQELRARNRK
jgi:hypothetical protein